MNCKVQKSYIREEGITYVTLQLLHIGNDDKVRINIHFSQKDGNYGPKFLTLQLSPWV
jgi:hypothetical protein